MSDDKKTGFSVGEYDWVTEKKKEFNKPAEPACLKAKAASEKGELKQVDEFMLQPYQGHGFELKKDRLFTMN